MSCFHRALIAVVPRVILSFHHRCDGDFGSSPRENFLVADYSISCNSPSYRGFFFPWAVMMSLVYPVGVPLLYTCLLLPHRKALEQDRTAALASMGSSILVQEFKSQFWYWESIDSIRRVALSGFLVFFGERARVGVALCIALGFQLLYLETKPFARRESNLLASLANFEISAVVLLLLNTQARSVKGGDVAGSFLYICESSAGAASTRDPGVPHIPKAERDEDAEQLSAARCKRARGEAPAFSISFLSTRRHR